jgi:cytochrome c-type biogenesis protein CcmH
MVRLIIALLVCSIGLSARATEAAPASPDPQLEARMLSITAELRCLVCQNQTIADSHAGLAEDLREEVRIQLRKGATDQQILEYMTARYGDFVLYRPRVTATTVLLWFGPAVALVAGIAGLLLMLRRRSRLADDQFEPDEGDALEAGGRS